MSFTLLPESVFATCVAASDTESGPSSTFWHQPFNLCLDFFQVLLPKVLYKAARISYITCGINDCKKGQTNFFHFSADGFGSDLVSQTKQLFPQKESVHCTILFLENRKMNEKRR